MIPSYNEDGDGLVATLESMFVLQLGLKKPMVAFWSILELALFILLLVSFFNILLGNAGQFNFKYASYLLMGVIVSALARNVHYAVKHPLLFLFAPLYGILHVVLLQPIRVWVLLTIRNVSWGTRQKIITEK